MPARNQPVDDLGVHGVCDARYSRVRDAFAANFADGLETGASFAVELHGTPVVDLWAGDRDRARSIPWQHDTIVNTYSTTKVATVLTILRLVDRGQLELDATVASYWPEFASGGKADVTLRHVLTHSAGVPGFTAPIDLDTLYDWDRCTARIAAEESWWPAGAATGYHSLTFGHILGEVARRVTGRSFARLFREQVADPLGADFQIGLAAGGYDRVAEMVAPRGFPKLDPESYAFRVLANPPITVADVHSTRWRSAEIPAANGHGNARSIARLGSMLASSQATGNGVRLSDALLTEASTEQSYRADRVLGMPIRWGLGVALRSDEIPVGTDAHTMFWGGYGGSLLVADRASGLSVGYAMNQVCPKVFGDPRTTRLINALYACR